MSNVNYDLKSKGVRLINPKDAWVHTKDGKFKLNPNYHFVGKMNTTISNFVITASDKRQPSYKGDICELNNTAKNQIVKHFFNEKGERIKQRRIVYFGIKKQADKSTLKKGGESYGKKE